MANVKLKNRSGTEVTYTGVNKVQLKKLDGTIEEYGGGTPSIGYDVTFTTDGTTYAVNSCLVGGKVEAPADPVISGKQFTGWYSGSTKITFPYTPTANITLTAGLVTAEYCTVANLGSSSPSSVTFTKSSGWSDTYETVVKDGDTFKKFPTMYRKVNTSASGQITSWTIATAQIDSTYHVYPCFLAEDGTTVLPYVLMGVSCSNSSSSMNSIAGYTSSATQTISNARTNARARGTGYQQMDWMIFKLWQDLLICAMETVNTNSGSGITTDALGIYWGSNYPWIDGITHNGSSKKFLFSYKPSAYVDSATTSTTDYQATSYTYSCTSGQEISALGYDTSNEFVNYPKSTTSNSSFNTYYCDSFYFEKSGTTPVFSLVGLASAAGGAFRCSAGDSWSASIGARLCYRPLSS